MTDQTTMEPFTLIDPPVPSHHLFTDVLKLSSAPTADHDLHFLDRLRATHPESIVTCVPSSIVPLRAFAVAGNATCVLNMVEDSFAGWRGYVAPSTRAGKGAVGERVHFARFEYEWKGEAFVVFAVANMQYVLSERRAGEGKLGPSEVVDRLILAVGDWIVGRQGIVWVYDRYWAQNAALFEEVRKASWDKVILDEGMKADLANAASKFFSSKEKYEDLGVPWKRGLLFHGPPGNGKTVSIKALMHGLYDREKPIPTLYVKNAPTTYDIRNVFTQARHLAPCMLVLEDVETIVTPLTRSYFFNEIDGLENNSGLLIVASTNFLDKLDPGLSKRPSRFDRKYLFDLPNEHERTLYAKFWRRKLKSRKHGKNDVEFPKKLCPAMAGVTAGFSFAFMQECFVASLLELAREDGEVVSKRGDKPFDDDNDDLEDYELWVVFKRQADALRKEMESQRKNDGQLFEWCRSNDGYPNQSSSSRGQPRPSPSGEHTNSYGYAHRYCCCSGLHPPARDAETVPTLGSRHGCQEWETGEESSMLPTLPYGKISLVNSAAFMLV